MIDEVIAPKPVQYVFIELVTLFPYYSLNRKTNTALHFRVAAYTSVCTHKTVNVCVRSEI